MQISDANCPADKLKVQARFRTTYELCIQSLHTKSTYRYWHELSVRTLHTNSTCKHCHELNIQMSHENYHSCLPTSSRYKHERYIQTLLTNSAYKYCHELNLEMSHANYPTDKLKVQARTFHADSSYKLCVQTLRTITVTNSTYKWVMRTQHSNANPAHKCVANYWNKFPCNNRSRFRHELHTYDALQMRHELQSQTPTYNQVTIPSWTPHVDALSSFVCLPTTYDTCVERDLYYRTPVTHTHTHAHRHKHAHTRTQTPTHSLSHTHTHLNTHAHTHARSCISLASI